MSILHPSTLVLHPDYRHLEKFMRSLPQRFENNEGEIIHNGRNILRTIEYEGVRYVIKSFRTPNIINRFVYGFFRASKAKRSYHHALLLQSLGIGTPQPVGYMNIRNGVLFHKSYYVSLESTCPHAYQELFEKPFDYTEEVLRAVGRVTALLHESGLAHKDYGRKNILFKRTDKGVEIDLVDLNRMYFGPVDMVAGCKNLERLPATPEMHRWLADEYAKARGFDADTCYKLMVKYRSRDNNLIEGKY